MPATRRPGKRLLYVELPEALGQQLDALAQHNRRTVTAEVILALEAHLGVSSDAAAATPPAKKKGKGK
jgi:hypothetical protein